jgi:hypothetical protein
MAKKKREPREWTDADPIGSTSEARWQEEQLGFRIDAFLHKRGWSHTSSTPGSFWMWHKKIKGVPMYVDREHALAIERSQEPDDIDGDEALCG